MKINTSKTVNDLDALINKLTSFHDNVLKEVTTLGQKVAKSHTKGNLAKSIKIQKETANKTDVEVPKEYAYFVENGRPAIQAANKVLRFIINGKAIFRKSVGPAKAQPFMKPAGLSMRQQAAKIVKRNWKKIL